MPGQLPRLAIRPRRRSPASTSSSKTPAPRPGHRPGLRQLPTRANLNRNDRRPPPVPNPSPTVTNPSGPPTRQYPPFWTADHAVAVDPARYRKIVMACWRPARAPAMTAISCRLHLGAEKMTGIAPEDACPHSLALCAAGVRGSNADLGALAAGGGGIPGLSRSTRRGRGGSRRCPGGQRPGRGRRPAGARRPADRPGPPGVRGARTAQGRRRFRTRESASGVFCWTLR